RRTCVGSAWSIRNSPLCTYVHLIERVARGPVHCCTHESYGGEPHLDARASGRAKKEGQHYQVVLPRSPALGVGCSEHAAAGGGQRQLTAGRTERAVKG